MKEDLIKLLKELEQIDQDERAKGLPTNIRMRNITSDVGLFLNILVKATKSKRILEIGTSNGYSTIWLGLAAKENSGKVTTLEHDPRKVKLATENLTRAGLMDAINLREGDAKVIIPTLEGEYDFIFIDAEKEDYITYFDLIFPKLVVGGIIIADNVVSHAGILQEYVNYVRANPNTQSCLIPVGRGEELTLKIR